jgi:pteridine reductase
VGAAICRQLGAGGARVVVHHHASSAAATELAASLPAGGIALGADLAAADGARRLLDACDAAGHRPDSIVHAAASFLRRSVLATTAGEWDAVFALNLRAFFLLAQEFARRREGAPAAGEPAGVEDACLVAISDSGAHELWTGYAAHCVSKSALLPLVRLLAKALAPRIRVNAVVPGPVLPEEGSTPERLEAMARRTLLGRVGDPGDVARAVAFLLVSRFTTGTIIDVTGGAHLWRGSLDRE